MVQVDSVSNSGHVDLLLTLDHGPDIGLAGNWSQGMSNLGIGQLARRAGVAIDTVRYYERNGLLAPAGRLASATAATATRS